jgi:hypothetical protein
MSISMTMEAFINRLKISVPPLIPAEQVGLCTPADANENFMLGACIYSIGYDENLQITGGVRIDASTMQPPPFAVRMNVLVTSYIGKRSGLAEDYKLIERVMQAMGDDSKLPIMTLYQPGVAVAPRVSLVRTDSHEMSKIWQYPNDPYRLSLVYDIRPVVIPSTRFTHTEPVGDVDYGSGEMPGTEGAGNT